MQDYRTCANRSDCPMYYRFAHTAGVRLDCGKCKDYDPIPINSKERIADELSEIAENLREAETVPVVTEQAEPTIKIGLDKLTAIADSEFEKALEKGTVKLVYEPENDAVSHPAHYTSGGIECIDCIKAALGQHFIGFLMGNVIKYSYRYKDKNGAEDLKKARWYLDRAIKEVEQNAE